jgi:hypothetical protein
MTKLIVAFCNFANAAVTQVLFIYAKRLNDTLIHVIVNVCWSVGMVLVRPLNCSGDVCCETWPVHDYGTKVEMELCRSLLV